MAYVDYIHCKTCDCKLVYDGHQSLRESLEENYGDPKAPVYTPLLLCPNCIATLEAENTDLRDKALRFDLDNTGIAQREAEALELVSLRARCADLSTLLEKTLNHAGELKARVAELEAGMTQLDDMLVVSTHTTLESYPDVKTALNALIDWHIEVERYFVAQEPSE